MTENAMARIREQPRFRGLLPWRNGFARKLTLSSPVLFGDEEQFIRKALESGQVGTAGDNIDWVEEWTALFTGRRYAVALSSGMSAIRLAIRLAGEKLYRSYSSLDLGRESLAGKHIFISDLMSADMAFSVLYEGGEPVFIDVDENSWGIDPEALKIAFQEFPDTKIVLLSHPYGFPAKADKIRQICTEHGALLIEDTREGFGAECHVKEEWRKAGTFGDYAVLSFEEDKILTGSVGGMLLLDDEYEWKRANYLAHGAFSKAPWIQHEDLGYDFGLSNLTAGFLRAQLPHLSDVIAMKKKIYERYLEGLDPNFFLMHIVDTGTKPNYLLPCVICDSSMVSKETRSDRGYTYEKQHGSASPMEIIEVLHAFQAEAKPIRKPLSMQPIFCRYDQVSLDGRRECYSEFDRDQFWIRTDVSRQLFEQGISLPSDPRMTEEEQEQIMDLMHACLDDVFVE